MITADIAPSSAPRTSGFYAAFLNAKGRVLNDVFVYPDLHNLLGGKYDGSGGENWIVEVDAGEAEALFRHIKRHKLRAKFDLRLLDDGEMGVWSVWRGEGAWTAHSIPGAGPSRAATSISLLDHRAPGLGRRILVPGSSAPDGVEIEGAEHTTEDSYTIRRYLRGVPEGQKEMVREVALPQESCVDYMGGIAYRKGCYLGQELTIRTHHTGVVRKRILPVMLWEGEEEPGRVEYREDTEVDGGSVPGETKMERVQEGEGEGDGGRRKRGLGKWLRGMGNVGLGLCRLEAVGEGARWEVKWEVEGAERKARVKAFVPSWHLGNTA